MSDGAIGEMQWVDEGGFDGGGRRACDGRGGKHEGSGHYGWGREVCDSGGSKALTEISLIKKGAQDGESSKNGGVWLKLVFTGHS